MKCEQCGSATEKPSWFVTKVNRHIVLKKQGERFYKYDLDLYSFHNSNGHNLFTARKGRKVIEPDAIALFGDAHCYWITPLSAEKQLCSRKCTIAYAAVHNYLLIRRSDGAQITPQQEMFDEYARVHQLDHALALIDEDEWSTPEREFLGLLSAILQFPDRLVALALTMIDEGKPSLAERAVAKLRSDFSLEKSAQYSAVILSRLGRYDAVDALYEELASTLGGREHLDPRIISSWAWSIAPSDSVKAIRLSAEAVQAKPTDNTIVENHLAILCDSEPEAAVKFFREHQFTVRDDVGFLAVGKAFLRTGLLSEAEDHFRVAALIEPDPLTKSYLAETLYRMNRPADSLLLCREATFQVEQFEQKLGSDFDGDVRIPVHYPYRQRKYLRRALLAIEGKCLMQVGELDSGRERLRDALDINLGIEVDDFFFDGIDSLITDVRTRPEIEQLLAIEQQQIVDLINEKKKADTTIGRLSDLVSAIASTQAEWEDVLLRLKDQASTDEVAEHFLSEIHSFCMLMSRKDLSRYQLIKKAVENAFPQLPSRAIEQIANAEFLLESHKDEGLPVYAGVIIEYSKALETAVNEMIIGPFIRANFHQSTQAVIEVPSTQFPRKIVELKFRGKAKNLALGELCLVLESRGKEWTTFCDSSFGSHAEWIRVQLPSNLRRVKDDFRNGCAHANSGSRRKAMEMKEYLNGSGLISMLGEIMIAPVSAAPYHSREGNITDGAL